MWYCNSGYMTLCMCQDAHQSAQSAHQITQRVILFYFFFIVVDFVIHWNETTMGLHVFPIPIHPPTSLSFNINYACMHAKALQLCLTLCSPMECSLPGSSVQGILQARTLERVAMPSSRGSSRPRDRTCIFYSSCIVGRFFTAEPPGKPNINYRP